MPKITPAEMVQHVVMAEQERVLEAILSERETEFIRVFDLHISDVIVRQKRTGFSEQIIAHIERNPRGCKGKTHVQIQNGPTECYENICRVQVKARELPETD